MKLTNLRSLKLMNNTINREDLASIFMLKNLRYLNISNCGAECDLEGISKLTRLNGLKYSYNRITKKNLIELIEMKNLKRVECVNCKLEDNVSNEIAILKKHVNLKLK